MRKKSLTVAWVLFVWGAGRLAPASAEEGLPPADSGLAVVDAASRAVHLVVWVLLLLALLPGVFILYRRLFSQLRRETPRATVPTQEAPAAGAEDLELAGDFIAAAEAYEAAGERAKAALLFEKGKDPARAAEICESLGQLDKAVQLYLRSGASAKAAALCVRTGNYFEAAKIFRNKGDHLRAAQALEKNGNRAAAAREYQEAGQHARAARLFREDNFYGEAAAAFRLTLGDKALDGDSLDAYYTYAAYLLLAGDRAAAADIYRRILALDPAHAKAWEKLRSLTAPGRAAPEQAAAQGGAVDQAIGPPAPRTEKDLNIAIAAEGDGREAADAPEQAVTLRRMLRHTRLEPRYSMRLWIQMMRVLGQKHRDNVHFGCLTPDQVLINMQDDVSLEPPAASVPAYTAPEVLAGASPDAASDIYSMGVILYEMVVGALEHIGSRRPSEVKGDIPPWLDDLIMKCIAPDRGARYGGAQEVADAILRFKSKL